MTMFWAAIINGAILSACLCFAVWLALSATPRDRLNGSTRHAIWWIVLLATLALPVSRLNLSVAGPKEQVDVVQSATTPLPSTTPSVQSLSLRVPEASRAMLPVEIPASPWLRWMLLFWVACSLILVIRFCVACIAAYRLAARAADAPPEWGAFISARRRIRVAISHDVAIPLCTGPFRPTILIPIRLSEQISAEDLRQVILHEAAHLTRRDDCTLSMQRLIEALCSLHPVVRWVTRQIDLEREVACDDIVAGMTQDPRSYAGCLARILPICGGVRAPLPASGMADSHSHISRRIALLVKRSPNVRARFLPRQFALAAILLAGSLAVLGETPRLISFKPARTAAMALLAAPMRSQPIVVAPARRTSVQIAQAAPVRRQPPIEAPATSAPPPSPLSEAPLYVFGANDVIAVTAPYTPAITGTYTIDPDGLISIPLIGDMKASGLHVPELRQLVANKFEEIGGKPSDISVQLLRNNSKRYTVVGAVAHPGPAPLVTATSILDAVATAGVLPKFSNPGKIVVMRGQQRIPFNYVEILKGQHMEQNIDLRDGDIIIVPANEEESK